MIFSLTAIDQNGQTQDFFCQIEQIELGFDLLSAVSATGHILLKAESLDEGKLTSFPVAVFDGIPFSENIRLLEREWQQILATPTRSQPSPMENSVTDSCTVYFSTSVGSQVENDLSGILQKSRTNNAQSGITGILLYIHGHIIQVLEGEEKAVEALYRRIEQDPRHTQVVRVFNKPIRHHLFGAWSMGYETITTRQFDDINEVIEMGVGQESAKSGDHSIILTTLKAFYKHNRLR